MVTFIRTPGGEELAILPRAEYEALAAARAEEESLVEAARAAFAAADAGLDDGLSAEEVAQLAEASSPLAFWMSRRGMSQAELATRSGLSQPFVSKLVRGRAHGSIETLRKLADLLGVTLDDLID